MQIIRHLLAVGVSIAALALGTLPADAQADEIASTNQPSRHCSILVSKAASDPMDAIIATSCSDATLNSDGRLNKTSMAKTSDADIAAANTLLIRFFDGANYSGDAISIYGDDGECDAEGYGIPWVRFDNPLVSGVSSFQSFGTCLKTGLWSGCTGCGAVTPYYAYGGDFSGVLTYRSHPSLGSFNDRTRSAKVYGL